MGSSPIIGTNMMIYKCKYCGKEFSDKRKLAGHTTFCKNNPKYKNNIQILSKNREKKDNNEVICCFCGKKIKNKTGLIQHEMFCLKNPNRKISKKELKQNTQKEKVKRVLSEEHKQKIREGLTKWRTEHYNEFIEYSRGKSKCCERFKDYLKSQKISFIEEYAPFLPERLFSLDIAFPEQKIGIEINGSQHYNSDGTLNSKSIEKQQYFEERGWKIIHIYYKECYKKDLSKFNNIFEIISTDHVYIQEDFLTRNKSKTIKEQEEINRKRLKLLKYNEQEEKNKDIVFNLLYNSGIDFSKSGWSKKAQLYLKEMNPIWNNGVFRIIRRYFPEFLKDDNVWKRKGSII